MGVEKTNLQLVEQESRGIEVSKEKDSFFDAKFGCFMIQVLFIYLLFQFLQFLFGTEI